MTSKTIIIGLVGIIILAGLSVNDAFAAAYIKFDGIDGESVDRNHDKWINLDSWSWGATQTGTGGGGGAGKVSVQNFSFDKTVDKASPKLFEALTTGKHIKEATLELCRPSGADQSQCYLVIKLTDVMVSGYQIGGSSENVPTDQISLNFAKIEFSYKPQKADGQLDSPVKATYDVKAAKKV